MQCQQHAIRLRCKRNANSIHLQRKLQQMQRNVHTEFNTHATQLQYAPYAFATQCNNSMATQFATQIQYTHNALAMQL
eukprot:11156408-Lingulodinium_polyedra.AAC.1